MSTEVILGFEPADFAEHLASIISKGFERPVDAFERSFSEALRTNLANAPSLTLRKPPTITLHPMYFKERCASLKSLAATGYETWYLELKFSTALSDIVEDVEIISAGFDLRELDYGPAGRLSHRLWSKPLKTQANHILRLNHIVVPASLFVIALEALERKPEPQQRYLANPKPGPRSGGFEHEIEGFQFVSFDHFVTGERYFCSCAKDAHHSMLSETAGMTGYVSDAWPRQVERLLADPQYMTEVCHLCISKRNGPEAASDHYNGKLDEFVVPYTNQIVRSSGVDKTTARAEVQQLLGLSRWAREAEMFSLVKQLFPSNVVLREASPEWLGRQRLDVYVPELALALEHQGEQHFQPVSVFGGAEALERTMERDALKRELCATNSVQLVEVKFDEPLTLASLRRRLKRFL